MLILDKTTWHKGLKARQFIKEDENIETFDFPRSVPELNSQEHVWKKRQE
ncbi:MAG: transposase [bacterium]